jgi:hypothetical protein
MLSSQVEEKDTIHLRKNCDYALQKTKRERLIEQKSELKSVKDIKYKINNN